MSSATVRDAIEKVRDPAANAVADIKEHAQRAGNNLAERSEGSRSAMRAAYRSARKTAGRVGNEMSHGYDVAKNSTVHGAEEAWNFVRARPVVSIAIAAGVGVLLGGFLLARSHRR